MKLFSLVTLFAHYFLTIEGETSVTISYRQNSRNRRSVLFTKEITSDTDSVVPNLVLSRQQNQFAPTDALQKTDRDRTFVSKSNFPNPESLSPDHETGARLNGRMKVELIDESDDDRDEGSERTEADEGRLEGDKGGLWRLQGRDHNRSSIRFRETNSALNSLNLSASSSETKAANNFTKSFAVSSSPVSAEHENALTNDGFKSGLEKTQKGNLIASILSGKSSLELTRGAKNGDSKNRTSTTKGFTKFRESRNSSVENPVEECKHAITASRDKWSQFCKLLFLLRAENVNKAKGKTSSREANEKLRTKGQNITGGNEDSLRSNLQGPKSQQKMLKTELKLSNYSSYQMEYDRDSSNSQTQMSSTRVKNALSDEAAASGIRKISEGENFQGQLGRMAAPRLLKQGRMDGGLKEEELPRDNSNGSRYSNPETGHNVNYTINYDSNVEQSHLHRGSSEFSPAPSPVYLNGLKGSQIREPTALNNQIFYEKDLSGNQLPLTASLPVNVQNKTATNNNQSHLYLNNLIHSNQGNQSSIYVPTGNPTVLDRFSLKHPNNGGAPNTPTEPSGVYLSGGSGHSSQSENKKQGNVPDFLNAFQTYSATTLPSVFRENLIPPLPQKWPETDAEEELWTDLDRNGEGNRGVSTEEDLDPNKVTNSEDFLNETKNKNETAQNLGLNSSPKRRSFEKISFVSPPAPHINFTAENNKYKIPESADYDEYVMEETSPDAMFRKDVQSGSQKLKESIPTVRIAGKADISDAPVAHPRERVSFVTVPPGTHWHLWGGFTGGRRRGVDPYFELSNGTGEVAQVYTAYWGSSAENSSFITGLWILRIGSGVALFTLVLTVAAQTVRFCQPLLSQKAVLTTNLSTSLAAAHVVFIFGIQATEGLWICGVVALFMHFLYLLTCNWILALSIRLLRSLLQKKPFHTAAYCIPVWVASLAVIVVSYGVNPSGYETRRFCWLSIERGMLFAFIGPVCTLLLANAGVCIACQKILLDATVKTDSNDKSDLRVGVSLLPLHGVAWFLTVVALEDDLSLALDCAAALATAAVGCLTLHFYVPAWQYFLHQHLPCPLSPQPSPPENKSLYPIPMATTLDSMNLPLLEAQLTHPSSRSYSLSSSSSTAALLEEHPLDCIYTGGPRREAY